MTAPRFSGAADLDRTIEEAIKEGRLPGAVVVVGHAGHVIYEKAYGERAIEPTHEPMTLDTIFDCASLTKVVATTACLMKLYEQGRYRLNDPVTQYIPEFQHGHSDITIRDLMTHFSGLQPDVRISPAWSGYEKGIELACTTPPQVAPRTEHIYSDINFELLGEIVHRLSGQTLAAYAHDQIYAPLGMVDTAFQPPAKWIPRIAPTERVRHGEPPLRGIVHDPTARYMGGIAGHAGVFSTARDLAIFCQMMLDGGRKGHKRLFSPLTVQKFTEPQTPVDQPVLRGLGWDIDSPYSSNRGGLFPIGSYGHTGFTGTSIWIDPTSRTYAILLANSVHPDLRPPIVPLRAKVATIVAAAVGVTDPKIAVTGYNELEVGPSLRRPIYRNGDTLTGLDVLERDGFKQLLGKRIGLITNHTGIDREGRRNVDRMLAAGVKLTALFSPEHGMAGQVDHPGIGDSTDPGSGVPVHSLYGEHLRPTPDSLRDVDALVFDIQDLGVHFYTYETTLGYCLEEAAKAHVPFYVLDRPNPITGARVEGPLLDESNRSFVGYLAGTPVRHGMTIGELAQMFNDVKDLHADLHVIRVTGWQRGDWFDSTNLPWVNPSPNIRSLKAAILYPGLCLMEFPTNFSVGRGTDAPFEQVGADFVDGRELAAYLNRRRIPGIRVYPTRFTPTESRFAGTAIGGVRFEITDRELVDSVRVGLELAVAIQHLHPGKIDWAAPGAARLVGSSDVALRISQGQDPLVIEESFDESLRTFKQGRTRWLLY